VRYLNVKEVPLPCMPDGGCVPWKPSCQRTACYLR